MSTVTLSDKGLSIFVFAAYHQLTSGEPVLEVVLRDSAGHAADPQGVREVEDGGLARVENGRAVFSDAGLAYLETVLQAIRATAGKAESGRAVA
ncbi:hypothetical protein P7D22_12200 [Lichenihabitans sp. Uapishka_5]|uniref:hypothetical protein n=1 Tax=Lichenihabitans sp. Uapishka_5 TaxID=3037302 RepID=UPI0029E807BF|nr:hypothetical protein [Lichenihabitans sp. Uapishka_5]MDX7951931.1 hypothetical protein [Lichenihabitans sp. Uapishka_5]